MSFGDEAVETLHGLGLTLCMARVYLALLRCGVSTAKTVSKVSGVTRQDVYRVMPKLEERGLVARALTAPATFRATPIVEGVSILMENRNEKTNWLQAKTENLVKNFRENKKIGGGGGEKCLISFWFQLRELFLRGRIW